MSKETDAGPFGKDLAGGYDARNRKLAPMADAMHFMTRLVLQDLPAQARILCVGVGTGAEIFPLAEAFPGWTFVGVDPSAPMLEVCAARLAEAGIADRCKLVPGHVEDVAEDGFDAVLSMLVAHFVTRAARPAFYGGMVQRLKPGGWLVNSEISFDLEGEGCAGMLAQWAKVQRLMGGTPESLADLPKAMRERLTVLAPEETEALLRQSGIEAPVPFYRAMMIGGWCGRKTA